MERSPAARLRVSRREPLRLLSPGALAQTVAGKQRGFGAAQVPPRAPGTDTRCHHDWLGVDGAVELLRGAVGDQLREVLLQDIGSFGKRLADRGHVAVAGQHPHRLRTLAWKNHRELHLGYISTSDAPQVKPPPTPWSMTLWPGLMRPSRIARSSARGTEAADVLPWVPTVTTSLDRSMPSFFAVASSMRTLA